MSPPTPTTLVFVMWRFVENEYLLFHRVRILFMVLPQTIDNEELEKQYWTLTYQNPKKPNSKSQIAFRRIRLAFPALVRPPTFVVFQNSCKKKRKADIISTYDQTYFKRYSKNVQSFRFHSSWIQWSVLYFLLIFILVVGLYYLHCLHLLYYILNIC